jgi:transcription elongation GreA/GreB family factor
MSQIKQQLHQSCADLLLSRIRDVEQAMHAVQTDAFEETKSSAGDKYETGRAMSHLEMEKLAGQLAEFVKSKNILDKIDPQRTSDIVQAGSIVRTNDNHYYIAISLGQILIEGKQYLCISPASPLGQVLLGKRKGDSITFRNQRFKIIDID